MYSCLLSFSVESCIRLIVKHFLTIYTFHFWLKQSYKCWALSKGATSTNLALLKFKLLWSQLCLRWFPCKNWGWCYSRALAPAVGALVGCLFFCRQNIQGLISPCLVHFCHQLQVFVQADCVVHCTFLIINFLGIIDMLRHSTQHHLCLTMAIELLNTTQGVGLLDLLTL